MRTTGLRNPIYRETEALIAQIDAVAALTRVPGAEQRVARSNLGHATSDMARPKRG